MWEPESPAAAPYLDDPPLVSVVTPCLNSARYLEQTIQSVLAQDYPRIEYIVKDGGSTDESLHILKRYEGRLRWVSEPDRGTADAINRGFELSQGEVFAFLNADDFYLPGAISAAVGKLLETPDAAAVYGDAWWVDEEGRPLSPYPVRDFDPGLLARECFICQPASFLRRDAFKNIGGMDPELDVTFDYELWMRLARIYQLRRIDTPLAYSRMHAANKSLGRRMEVFRQTFQILLRHYGYVPFQWIYGYVCYRADRRDQFFEPLQPSILRYLASLPAGLSVNRDAMARYFAEWLSVMTWAGFRRRLQGSR
jgi:glycosyltransferase involved in cell wall biosynthesis